MAKMALLTGLQDLFMFLSVNEHYQSISRGVLDTRDAVYFLTLVFFFLLLTHFTIGGRKW